MADNNTDPKFDTPEDHIAYLEKERDRLKTEVEIRDNEIRV